MTVPGISQVATKTVWGSTWYWAFTGLVISRMLEDVFGQQNSRVDVKGNVLSAVGFLHGLAAHELTEVELCDVDNDYQVIITARAIKKEQGR